MINLNDSKFDAGSGIFNGGVAGIVTDVVLSAIERTTKDSSPSGYKLVFTKDGNLNHFVNYIPDDNEKAVMAVSMMLKNLVVAFYGKSQQLPSGNNMIELTDKCIQMLASKVNNTQVAVHTSYGTLDMPSIYMRMHKYSPFIAANNDTASLQLAKKNLYIRPDVSPSADPVVTTPAVGLPDFNSGIKVPQVDLPSEQNVLPWEINQ